MQTYVFVLIVMVLGWSMFFVFRSRIAKGGGFAAYARAHLNTRFRLSDEEQVTAAWNADTVPKLSAGEKVAEVVGAAAAVVAVGFEYVGRPLGVACTSKNRVLILDREDNQIRAYGPDERPRFTETGKKGKGRPSQTRVGWEAGTVVRFEPKGEEPLEIDIPAEAASVLVRWSEGKDVTDLVGPYPAKGAI